MMNRWHHWQIAGMAPSSWPCVRHGQSFIAIALQAHTLGLPTFALDSCQNVVKRVRLAAFVAVEGGFGQSLRRNGIVVVDTAGGEQQAGGEQYVCVRLHRQLVLS